MKNYDELTNDLLERRDRYIAEQKKKRKRVIGVTSSLSCFCLVALLGFGMWQVGLFNSKPPVTSDEATTNGKNAYVTPVEPDNTQTTQPNNTQTTQPDNTQTTQPVNNENQTDITQNDDPARIMWVINRVEGQLGAAKLNFSTDKYYSETKTLTDIADYLGKDMSNLQAAISQGFKFLGRYETDFYYELDGKLAYDSCAFGYEKNDQQITINVSKIGVPYDCIYVLNNPTVSNLNGVEVTIGGIYKTDNSGYCDLVFADFSHAGKQYRVSVRNIPSDGDKDAFVLIAEIIYEITK